MIQQKYRLIIFLIALLLVGSSVTGFYILPQSVYYGTIIAICIWMLLFSGQLRIGQSLVLLFIIVCAFSILINQPASFFRAWYRLLGFSLILLTVSPLLVNEKTDAFRLSLFYSIVYILVGLSVGSFVCYFLDINFFVRNDELLAIEAGHFSGLFRHSMLLGPASAIASIFVFVKYLTTRKKWLLLVFFACVGSTFFSASRGALGGCVLGLVVSYIHFYRGRLSKALLTGLFFVALLALTYPIWGGVSDFVMTKQENNVLAGGTFVSREEMWAARLSEITSKPLTGVGFCCVDTNLVSVNKTTGIIEPGSSWLAVFSMTGVFGFIFFLLLFVKSFKGVYISTVDSESCFFCGVIAFYFLHLLVEGYVLAAGSFMGMMYWLLIGSIWGYLNRISCLQSSV